jgi:glutaminyl-peptide cyclotransferase
MRTTPAVMLVWCVALSAPLDAQPAPQAPSAAAAPANQPQRITAEVVATFPHDPAAFTQGLIVDGGIFYESTGRPGTSQVRRVDVATGRVLAARSIPPDQFGEGLTRWRGELISLTWQHGIAHRWDVRTLRPRGRFRYRGEGWGLTTLGNDLILSDGTPDLRVLDPRTFRERRWITVTFQGRPLAQLNELEVVDGRIWANVWQTDAIAVIDPVSGVVTHVLDLGQIARQVDSPDTDAVLNGIAFDPTSRRLFVTGKLWPHVYELRVPDLGPAL